MKPNRSGARVDQVGFRLLVSVVWLAVCLVVPSAEVQGRWPPPPLVLGLVQLLVIASAIKVLGLVSES